MATADTVELGPPHAPKEESIKAFKEIEVDLKKYLQHARHSYNSESYVGFSGTGLLIHAIAEHEPEYFAAVANLSDEQLTTFSGMLSYLALSGILID
jgi:hypothetical protein